MDLRTRQGRREQGQRIQRAVERAGFSIEELAGRIGCSRALLYQYLSGTTLAQPDRLQQIAAECGVSLDYFYVEADPSQEVVETGRPETERVHPAEPLTRESVESRLKDSIRALQDLVEAQGSSPDYRAEASTCERILSLAAQLGDRVAQAKAQNRLGIARLRLADYQRAADALGRAVALAQEIADIVIETSARQSLGNALLAMGRDREAREQFATIASGPVFRGRWQGTLSLGAIFEMLGEYQEAMRRFDEAAHILEEGEADGQVPMSEVADGLLYVNANRTNVYLDGGDFRGARALAERCLADAETLGNADQHLEALFNLAWCDFHTGAWSAAYRGFGALLRLARFIGDQGREALARAWLAILLAAMGDHDTAVAQGKDALAASLSRGDRRAELYSQLALADAYTAADDRDSEARYHTNQALAVATSLRQDRAEIECRLRGARYASRIRDYAEIGDSAGRALVLAQRLGSRHLESLAHYWLALHLLEAAIQRPEGGAKAPVSGAARPAGAGPATWQRIREAAGPALRLADEIGLVEAQWRIHDLLARVSVDSSPADFEEAETHLRTSVAILDALRLELIDAGIPDTLLENEECAAVYGRLVRLLRQRGRRSEADALLDQVAWPPLIARLEADFSPEADESGPEPVESGGSAAEPGSETVESGPETVESGGNAADSGAQIAGPEITNQPEPSSGSA